jgi:hypothetical protein
MDGTEVILNNEKNNPSFIKISIFLFYFFLNRSIIK